MNAIHSPPKRLPVRQNLSYAHEDEQKGDYLPPRAAHIVALR
jgi:hypothetical protein